VRPTGLALAILLAAGPTSTADLRAPRPVESTKPLTPEARAELNHLLRKVAKKATPKFREAAMTMEQARHFADVSPRMTWQAEYAGWFVFGCPGLNGEPSVWSGIVFVQKGTNLVGYYRQTW
jgi:hypothetical protein